MTVDITPLFVGAIVGAIGTVIPLWLWWREERHRAVRRAADLEHALSMTELEAAGSRLTVELLRDVTTDTVVLASDPTPPNVPSGLLASCLAGECVLFAGTGVAAAAGQPTWREALLSVLSICRERHRDPLWERLVGEVREDQYDLVADLLVDRLGRAELFELLREVAAVKRGASTTLLDGLARVPFAGVITNLWDDLAVELYADRVPRLLDRDATSDLVEELRERRFFVLPAFGSVADDSLLLTNDALAEYLDDHGSFKRFLGSILGTRSVLFVGTGVAGIEQLLRSSGMRGAGRREHFALVPRSAEAELHQTRLAKRYNVHLVLYELSSGHEQAVEFVEALADQTKGADARRDRGRRAGEALRSVHLQNIGPFPDLELEFDEDWTVMLGDNGCGKSTVLRAIALAMAGDDERALRHGEQLLRAGAASGTIEVRFDGATFETRLRRERTRVSATARQITPVQTGEWLALGFPPIRGLSLRLPTAPDPPLFAGPSVDDVLPLIAGGVDERLDDVTQWLLNAFAAGAARGDEQIGAVPAAVTRFFSVMSRLSDHADDGPPFYEFGGLGDDALDVLVATQDGRIPLKQLSQGMLSVLSWTGTLITRLEDLRRDGGLPEHNAALVLIDELDAHLHPAWQRTIAGAVRAEFPNVQVIATTHSPLVVGGLAHGKLWRLHRDLGDAMAEKLDPKRYVGRRFDQILGAAPFDETSARDPETERMLRDYTRYVGREDLKPDEVKRLRQAVAALDVRLATPEELFEVRQGRELIAEVAEKRLAAMSQPERERVLAEIRRQLNEAITGSSPKP